MCTYIPVFASGQDDVNIKFVAIFWKYMYMYLQKS